MNDLRFAVKLILVDGREIRPVYTDLEGFSTATAIATSIGHASDTSDECTTDIDVVGVVHLSRSELIKPLILHMIDQNTSTGTSSRVFEPTMALLVLLEQFWTDMWRSAGANVPLLLLKGVKI